MKMKLVPESLNESFSFEERENMDTYDLLEKLEELYKVQLKAESDKTGDSDDILAFVKEDIQQWVDYIFSKYPRDKAYMMTKASYISAATGKRRY